MKMEIKEVPVAPKHKIIFTLEPDDIETLKGFDFHLYQVGDNGMPDVLLLSESPEQSLLLYDIIRDLYNGINLFPEMKQ